jgi:hypothetical protein
MPLQTLPQLALSAYTKLLRCYPRPFRSQFGPEMIQVFRDASRDALRRSGPAGLLRLWLWTGIDLVITAGKERVLDWAHTMSRRRRHAVLVAIAVAFAIVTGWANTHTNEVTALMLLLVPATFGLGVAHPLRAWRWALLVGASVPASQAIAFVFHLHVPYPNQLADVGQSCIAMVPAMLGAYAGAAVGRRLPRRTRNSRTSS